MGFSAATKKDETITRSDISDFRLLWQFVRPDKLLFFMVSILIITSMLVVIVGPILIQISLTVLENNELDLSSIGTALRQLILLSVIGYAIFAVLNWLIRAVQGWMLAKISNRSVHRLRSDVYTKILNNNLKFFGNSQVGELVSKVSNDSTELMDFSNRMVFILTNMLVLITVVLTMFLYSVELTLFTLSLLPFNVLIVWYINRFSRKASKEWRHKFGLVNSSFNEIFGSIQISKSFGRENENYLRFKQLNEATFQASKKRGLLIFIVPPIMDLFRHAITIMILLGGAILILSQNSTIPVTSIFFFFILLDYYYGPLTQLINNWGRFQSGFAALDRMLYISANDSFKEYQGESILADHLEGKIEFVDLTFCYNDNLPVLKDINLTIQPGERIAVVGHTGAGKTTLVSLLLRFYDKNTAKGSTGDILLDGIPLEKYDLTSLRKNIGLVSQTVFLFNGTIRENLTLANPTAKDEDLWRVLKMTQAYDLVKKRGLDFVVGERGKHLSLGERQLISLSRVLLADPRILILDEATSSIDLFTERKIQEAIEVVLRNRTSIVIAHRLSTIANSDRIIVLDNGRIVEEGSHEELLKRGKNYAKIYETYFKHQSADYLGDKD